MVDILFVVKSIDDAIWKCSTRRIGSNSLNNKIKGTLNKFAEKTKNNTIEQGLIIGGNGEELDWHDGTYENVSYDEDDVINALDKNNGKDLVFEHNHVGSFIDKRQSEEDELEDLVQSNMPTLLSMPDIQIFFETTEYNGKKITPFKSITADSTNGTRMTLTRIDGDGEDLTNNHVLKNISDSRYEVNEAWKNMYSRWATFFNTYNENLKTFTANYRNEHYQKYYDEWISKGKDDNVWQEFWSNHNKERNNYAKQMIKEYYAEDVINKSVKEFKDIGFELYVEWRNEH